MDHIRNSILALGIGIILGTGTTFLILSDQIGTLIESGHKSDADNRKLIGMLEKYEHTQTQLQSFGWSQSKIDRFITDGCLPYIESH